METVPEKIFGYKILQESASQAKVPFEVGSFPVSLPGNLEMTANREKPEQLTFFFFEEMPKPTKGTIYLDTSKKGVTKFKTRRHNSYRAEVTYNGVKYRKRSVERADCEQFLAQLAERVVSPTTTTKSVGRSGLTMRCGLGSITRRTRGPSGLASAVSVLTSE